MSEQLLIVSGPQTFRIKTFSKNKLALRVMVGS